MMNMMNMMKQAQNIQKRLLEVQEDLANADVTSDSANGVVVTCDGKGIFKSIKLSKEAINPENPSSVSDDDLEMLEDLITTTIKSTAEKARVGMEEKMKSVTGGINIPGLF